jgi:hypothetical protein
MQGNPSNSSITSIRPVLFAAQREVKKDTDIYPSFPSTFTTIISLPLLRTALKLYTQCP